MILPGLLLAILLSAMSLVAQDIVEESDALTPEPDATALDPVPAFTPLTLRQNYSYTVSQIFGAPALFRIAGRAAIDHLDNDPKGWGSAPTAYAVRFASHLGVTVVRENIAFGIRALDGEDPRYERSGKGGLWKRTAYATGHTFAVRSAKGALMPAWSMLVAEYSTPFIAQQWRPNGTMGGRELRTGSVGVGLSSIQTLF